MDGKVDEQLMDLNAVADRLDIAPHTARRLIERGQLGHVRVGKLIKISEQQLEWFLNNYTSEPTV